jgi:AcrR family transcriptional regulator
LAPREVLVRTAARLFYREGINAVGIDRIVSEAGITRGTLYRHFGGKEGLVLAYLNHEDELIRSQFASAAHDAATPSHLLELLVHGVAEDAARHHLRGCPFINAAAEFPDPDSAVRQLIGQHREWFRTTLEDALRTAGRDEPAAKARSLVFLRDAVLIGSYLDAPGEVRQTFLTDARTIAGLA